MDIEKLDNPTWNSLTETHKDFAIHYHDIKFYQPEYCPFGGFTNPDNTATAIDSYSLLTNNFYVVGSKPHFNDKVQLKKELVCNQMLLDRQPDIMIAEEITELVTAKQKTDLFDLVNLVQPGYFKAKTSDLGKYYGIYKNDELIAVTGERMKMNGYTEVSAVVTHPDHTGRGYAKQLVAYTSKRIVDKGNVPYLHVTDTNTGAIELYKKLGFWTRRKISFWNFVTIDNK